MKVLYYEFSYAELDAARLEFISGIDKATCPHCGQFVELHDVAIAVGAHNGVAATVELPGVTQSQFATT